MNGGEEEEEGGFDLEHWRSCTEREKGLVGIFFDDES